MSGPRTVSIALTIVAALGWPAVARAQDVTSQLSIHGYLTQGFGISSRYQSVGLTKDGTFDYGRVAVVARYDASPDNRFVVQLAHRRLGDSPAMQFEDNVKLDMAFFEHAFGDGSAIRVGKLLMPFGIYNEVRYAGALLPFYRAPMSVYWEGTYTNETIDGLAYSRRFRAGKPWELSADLFAGSYGLLEFGTVPTSPTTTAYLGSRLEAKDAFGGQLWLSTPIEGLRVGLHGRHHTDIGGLFPRGSGASSQEWAASLDGTFDKWQLRAEALRGRSLGAVLQSRYAQAGWRPMERFSINAQTELSDINSVATVGGYHIKMLRDNAVGTALFLGPMAVVKLEAHHTRGFSYEQPMNLLGAGLANSYFIGSLSVSF